MLLAVISGFLLAIVAPSLRRAAPAAAPWLLAALPAMLFLYFCTFLGRVSEGNPVAIVYPWMPDLDIAAAFYVDGLSLTFALLISGIGTFIVLYAGAYLKGHPDLGRFLAFILMFKSAMLGLVLADDIVTFFIFWELTSITSFLLIGFDHKREKARRAAVQALFVTGGGGLALLAGLIIMAQVSGETTLSAMNASGFDFAGTALYGPILILVLAGAFTKSAQVPFHFWLPNAMEAPTPVSAFLHSATMVKAGVYLMARVNPALGDTGVWAVTLTVFGAATFLFGTMMAVRNTDLKQILAQTTVASLGLLTMLIGIGGERALEAAMLYLVAHSLFKGALFMVAGSVDHEAGTREVTSLSGLGKAMPYTAAAGFLAALSMAGLPPFFGFIAKEIIYKATAPIMDSALPGIGITWAGLITAIAVLANALMLAAAFLAGIKPFIGKPSQTPKMPHEGPVGLWVGALILAVTGLLFGVVNGWPGDFIITPAVSAVLGESVVIELKLWHGFNLALFLSIVTVGLGFAIFCYADAVRAAIVNATGHIWGPDQGFDQLLDGIIGACRRITRRIQTGTLRHYMTAILAVVALILFLPSLLLGDGLFPGSGRLSFAMFGEVSFAIAGAMILTVVGGCALIFIRSRLLAIMSAGVLGLAVALIFLQFSAPDLAFTQLMAETLSVVILTLVITRLPVFEQEGRPQSQRIGLALLAVVIGVGFTGILLSVSQMPLDLSLSEYFNANSYTEALGRNIVNVILVDFRALDTLGEIVVVAAAGLSAIALIRIRARAPAGQSATAAVDDRTDPATAQPIPASRLGAAPSPALSKPERGV